MGADNSKEESRSNQRDDRQRRTQYVTQQNRVTRQEQASTYQATYQSPNQTLTDRSRTPYSNTPENLLKLQSAIKQASQPNNLERSRNPYNYNSEELHGIKQSPNLYPNLNVGQEDSFVHVNNYRQPSRFSPQPSAPPAAELNVEPNVSSSPRHPLSQADVVQKVQTSHVNAAPQPSALSHNILGTAQSVNISANKQITSPNAPGPSNPGNTPEYKNGPKSGGSHNILGTAQSVNISANKQITSPNAPGPSNLGNTPANKNGPKSGGSHNILGTAQLVNISANKQITSPNAPGPSNPGNTPAYKNGPKSGGRGRNNDISCPTCGQRYGITIFQCANGHACCKDCRSAERSCGKCLSPITDMRNIALEAVVADLSATCQNPGCTLRFKFDEMERHLKECPFGEMDCPMGTVFGKCSIRCKVADMAAHFDECHKEQREAEIGKEMFVFNICMETHKMFLIKNGPHTFLVHVQVEESDRKISMTVQLLGTKMSAEKWTYEFHVYNKRQPLRKYLFVDSCQSISTPVKDIFKDDQCAILPLSYAMTFVNESALTYKFYIKKEMNQRRGRPRNKNDN